MDLRLWNLGIPCVEPEAALARASHTDHDRIMMLCVNRAGPGEAVVVYTIVPLLVAAAVTVCRHMSCASSYTASVYACMRALM